MYAIRSYYENVNSQPFMRWRDRFGFVMEAVKKAEAETGERKGHYLNVTAPTPEDMYKRAEFAKQLGAPIIMHDYLTGGFCVITSYSIHYTKLYEGDRRPTGAAPWPARGSGFRGAGCDRSPRAAASYNFV